MSLRPRSLDHRLHRPHPHPFDQRLTAPPPERSAVRTAPLPRRMRGHAPRPSSSSLSAARAAYIPQSPCTPAPGGVDDEQRYTPLIDVLYGSALTTGRKKSCRSVLAPPMMSPPTRF